YDRGAINDYLCQNSYEFCAAKVEQAGKLEGESDSGYRQLVFLADGVLNAIQTVLERINSRRCFDSF
ncbi:MAG: hypothetical protein JWN70_799, partial [Planctomycetaceae bacterium]|nr:hypothetical protein [Planctomycetaceae bacterium]